MVIVSAHAPRLGSVPDPSASSASSASRFASPAPARPVRVILVDDDPLTRAAIKPLLRPGQDYAVVAEAGDGREAIDVVGRIEADIVLMDLGMPVMDGIEATRQICAAPRHPHVVALTTWDVDDAVVRVIEAGAVGYLLKYSASEELHAGLRRVMAGESVLSPGALAELLRYVRSQPTAPAMTAYDLRSQERQHAVAQAQQAAAGLSRRELEVIAAAAEGLTTEEIANRLYISVSTVKAHLRSAQERVGARNRVHLAVLAERAGLLG